MKILVLNCGSSSLKYQLIDMDNQKLMCKGNFERIGEQEAFLTHKVNGEAHRTDKPTMNHVEAFKLILDQILHPEYGSIKSLDEIDAIGHRVVAGGEYFNKSELVTDEIIEKIEKCIPLAPLHNPAALQGIAACKEVMPGVPMAVTFDTAFHQTMPKENYIFPIPYEYYEKYGIRRYGAHGTSHLYVSQRVAEIMGKRPEEIKVVTCHMGQGSSICAVEYGKSVDTSMGLSPISGIPMVTRCGDIDPSVVTTIMERENLTPAEVTSVLNKKSGLHGISGMVPDFREIELASYDEENNPRATLAVKIFTKTIAQFVAKYAVSMHGIDAIVFTGGIGENQINIRKSICKHLEWMGVEIDEEANNIRGEERLLTKPSSKIQVYLVPTDEEMVIARDTKALVENL